MSSSVVDGSSMAAASDAVRPAPPPPIVRPHRRVSLVKISGLVISKVVMHCEKERNMARTDTACGFLTGMVEISKDKSEAQVEVTNCFPMPKRNVEEDDDINARHQQLMLRSFRAMNIDYLLLGFYQCAPFGALFSEMMAQSMLDYYSQIEDSICIVYDPVKCSQGQLDVKAYRLSLKAIEFFEKGVSVENLKSAGLNYSNFIEELPVVIKNSRLSQIMLCKMALAKMPGDPCHFLEMAKENALERNLKHMMANVDVLNTEIIKYNRYLFAKQRYMTQREAWILKRLTENEMRRNRDEPLLPVEEEFDRNNKPPQSPRMLDGLLAACNINANVQHCLQASDACQRYLRFNGAKFQVSAGNLSKLHIVQALIDDQAESKLSI
ncbi:Mov34/MPN/PAD-1 family protein [Trichuris suis]|nr:Mov34/MPN/PAD-1 family protein [Trichuris suis]